MEINENYTLFIRVNSHGTNLTNIGNTYDSLIHFVNLSKDYSILNINNSNLLYRAYEEDNSYNLTLSSKHQARIVYDTIPPEIIINNPVAGEDENANPVLYKVTLNEQGSSCKVYIDLNKYNMTTSDSLTYEYEKEMENGNHEIYFKCKDLVNNSKTSSLLNFNFYKAGQEGTGNIIEEGERINLSKIVIESENRNFYIGEENKLYIYAYGIDGNYTEIDSLSVELKNDIKHDLDYYRKEKGVYEVVTTFEKEIEEELIYNITAQQGAKIITEEFNINFKKKTAWDLFLENIRVFGGKLQIFIYNNQMFVGIVFTIIFLILVFSIVFKNSKNKKI
ncbi:MAG: hypothetical protein ACOCV1_08350 [Bacillota bacterium]